MGVRYARKRLDANLRDVGRAIYACVSTAADDSVRRLADLWQPSAAVLPCLSVRSGLDLLLACVDWPAGSEVVVSAVTIPHIPRLIREHGYVPVGVDVDPATLDLDPADVEDACTPRTRAVLVAHLFGTVLDTAALAALAGRRQLMLIEDRAQSYDGVTRALGGADVAMYSFGTIKTATCFGGAVLLVGDPELRARMTDRQRSYPVQRTTAYLVQLVKVAVLLVVSRPRWYPLVTRVLDRLTGDYDHVVRSISRGFGDGGLLKHLRQQPCAALLATMAGRLATYDVLSVVDRREAGTIFCASLGRGVRLLGRAARSSSHWLVAVTSREPEALVEAGRSAGFDLTTGSSTLVSIDQQCVRANAAMRAVVYLPVDATMPLEAVLALAAVVKEVETGRDTSPALPPVETALDVTGRRYLRWAR